MDFACCEQNIYLIWKLIGNRSLEIKHVFFCLLKMSNDYNNMFICIALITQIGSTALYIVCIMFKS